MKINKRSKNKKTIIVNRLFTIIELHVVFWTYIYTSEDLHHFISLLIYNI